MLPPLWLYPNAGEFGYYRWSMATAPLLAIAQIAPEGMTPRERVGYLGNASALLQAGLLHADDFLEILSRFAGDTSPEVISAVLDGVWLVRFTFIRPDLADASRVDRMVAVDPHEAQRPEVLEHLAEGADVAQRACAPQAYVRLVSLRLEVVDVVRVHDPAKPSHQVKQCLAARKSHRSSYLPQAPSEWE